MKTGLTTSVILHATVLGFGLFSLSAPKAFDVSDVEALPVEIVSVTQLQQGDKKATLSEKPAPTPTKKPDPVPDATKIGENKVDTDKPATPEPTPKEVKTAAVPKPSPEPTPKPVEQPKPEPVKQPEPKPAPVPATEVTPQPQPKQDVKPDPVAETIVAENAEAEAVKLPVNAPSPEARPQPPKAETAKTPDRKDAEKPTEQASRPKSDEKEFNADEVAALLNKEKASGGGAKRSTEQAALGSEKQSNSSKLSQSEGKIRCVTRFSVAGTFRPVPPMLKISRSPCSSSSTRRERSKAVRRSFRVAVRAVSNGLRLKPPAAPWRAAHPTIFPRTNTTPGPT